jgi:hypothetical protein
MQSCNSMWRWLDAAGQLNSMLDGFSLAYWRHDRRKGHDGLGGTGNTSKPSTSCLLLLATAPTKRDGIGNR